MGVLFFKLKLYLKKMPKITLLIFLLVLLNNCTTAAVGTSVIAKTGVVVAQERTAGDAVDDFTIWTKLKHLYLHEDASNLLSRVSIEVIEGRVHLTGKVPSVEARVDAVKLAWRPSGVKEVINDVHIQEDLPEDRTMSMVVHRYRQSVTDKWIASAVRSKLLFAKNVRSLNYNIEVVDRIVYLIGIAQDTNELNLVTNIASTVKHVDKVVSHVRLKNDETRK